MSTYEMFVSNEFAVEKAKRLLRITATNYSDWREFREAALAGRSNFGNTDGGRVEFVAHVKNVIMNEECENEIPLMLAILYAIDYARLADDIVAEMGKGVFYLFQGICPHHLAPAMACFARDGDDVERA